MRYAVAYDDTNNKPLHGRRWWTLVATSGEPLYRHEIWLMVDSNYGIYSLCDERPSIIATQALVSNTPAANSSAAGSSAAGSSAASTLSGTITGGGASSQESAMTAWVDGFQSANSGVKVQYNPVGSGAGRKGFLAGQYQFAGSDSAMKEDEQKEATKLCGPDGAVQVPAYISPIAVAFNLPGVEHVNMDADTIASVFAKKISLFPLEVMFPPLSPFSAFGCR